MKQRIKNIVPSSIFLAGLLSLSLSGGRAVPGESLEWPQGRFVKLYWYEKGIEHGNPFYNHRFRVNSPEAVLLPGVMDRTEARGNGMMQILMEENLGLIAGAALYLEIWGGHPGTSDKRVTLNGRTPYLLPEVGTAGGYCTHSYPRIPLKLTDLVNGYNAIQFACGQGTSFWGHFIVDNASLMAVLQPDHPDLSAAGFQDFQADVLAMPPPPGEEKIPLRLDCPGSFHDVMARVDYWGFYEGYDENGNTQTLDWHGFTKNREPQAILGSSNISPFEMEWDTRMLPAQDSMAVKAVIHFHKHPNLVYITPPLAEIEKPASGGKTVKLLPSESLPRPFWSRAGQKKSCVILLDEDPGIIERAELHIVIWDGGSGTVKSPFTLNGVPLAVAGNGRHDVLYQVLPLNPSILRKGENRFEVFSDTEHHGIEVLLPGPALMVRY